jgi:V/A-type H+/Na+-transporting ATPase subunit K
MEGNMKKYGFVLGALLIALLGSLGFAQEAGAAAPVGTSIGGGLVAIGAGLALGLAALGVGIAQSSIGAAAAGAVAEDRSLFGQLLIYIVIPETLVIFGFLVVIFFLSAVK